MVTAPTNSSATQTAVTGTSTGAMSRAAGRIRPAAPRISRAPMARSAPGLKSRTHCAAAPPRAASVSRGTYIFMVLTRRAAAGSPATIHRARFMTVSAPRRVRSSCSPTGDETRRPPMTGSYPGHSTAAPGPSCGDGGSAVGGQAVGLAEDEQGGGQQAEQGEAGGGGRRVAPGAQCGAEDGGRVRRRAGGQDGGTEAQPAGAGRDGVRAGGGERPAGLHGAQRQRRPPAAEQGEADGCRGTAGAGVDGEDDTGPEDRRGGEAGRDE